jgi:hypothetical protein
MGEVGVRLRQVVIAARELEPTTEALRSALGLGEPFADPGVGEFGLRNSVFALGDQFLEVISPQTDSAPAARWLERRGSDGGYMLIFQLDDLEAARARVAARGIRTVWSVDLPDISGTHLHPADIRGAIVSLDRADPPGSWRWGGPEWTGREGRGAPGRVTGVEVEVPDPEAAAARWSEVLGVPVEGPRLRCDDAVVRFVEAGPEGDCVRAFDIVVPEAVRRGREEIDVGGVRLRLHDEEV